MPWMNAIVFLKFILILRSNRLKYKPESRQKLWSQTFFVKSLNEALNKFSYDATQAGLEYKIERKEYGIQINVHGYSEKASAAHGCDH